MPVVSSVFAQFQGAGFAKATCAAGGRPSRGEEKPGPCVRMTVVSQLRYLRKTRFQGATISTAAAGGGSRN